MRKVGDEVWFYYYKSGQEMLVRKGNINDLNKVSCSVFYYPFEGINGSFLSINLHKNQLYDTFDEALQAALSKGRG